MLLMFIAGLDLHLKDLAKAGKVSALAGILGVIFPLVLGVGAGLAYQMETGAAVFVGLILAATSVSISAQTLMELKVLRSRVGISLLGAAVFDDILVVVGLSVFTAVAGSTSDGLAQLIPVFVGMLAYIFISIAVGWLILPKLSGFISRLPISQGLIAATLAIILAYGWFAEVVGSMAALTGAFIAGLLLARSPVRDQIQRGISTLAYSLFVPIFFVNIGLIADARQLSGQTLGLFGLMLLIAVIGKVFGAGLGANLGGLTRRESAQIGVGMMSRGEVGLIVASVGIAAGIITEAVFAALVGVVILTTLATPPALRALFSSPKKPIHSEAGEGDTE
jgi:Kef-type K+ transport system membrane component KefB